MVETLQWKQYLVPARKDYQILSSRLFYRYFAAAIDWSYEMAIRGTTIRARYA